MYLFCLSLILLLCAPSAFAVQDCELNGEAVNPANGNTTAGKTGMMICRERGTGKLARERELRAGKFVGLERFYNSDGKLEREHYINDKGNRDGQAREFFPDGQMAHEETYRNGSVVGVARYWYANRKLKRVVVRSDEGSKLVSAEFNDRGQLRDLQCSDRPVAVKEIDDKAWCGHGAHKPVVLELYSNDGIVVGRVGHLAGKMVLSELLWGNGKLQNQRETNSSTMIERSFSSEGVKLYEMRWSIVGNARTQELEQKFHKSGTQILERRWQAGELMSEKTWYLNSQPKSYLQYSNRTGERICQVIEYNDNGTQASSGTYLVRNGYLGRPVGTLRSYDKEGHLRSEHEYDANSQPTREREFDENGVVKRDDAVFEDGSRKAFVAQPK